MTSLFLMCEKKSLKKLNRLFYIVCKQHSHCPMMYPRMQSWALATIGWKLIEKLFELIVRYILCHFFGCTCVGFFALGVRLWLQNPPWFAQKNDILYSEQLIQTAF